MVLDLYVFLNVKNCLMVIEDEKGNNFFLKGWSVYIFFKG